MFDVNVSSISAVSWREYNMNVSSISAISWREYNMTYESEQYTSILVQHPLKKDNIFIPIRVKKSPRAFYISLLM